MFKGYNENRDVEINPKMNLFQFKKKMSSPSQLRKDLTVLLTQCVT